MAAEFLSTLDAALLSLETSAQQLNILAVLLIEPDPDIPSAEHYRVARDRIENRLPLVSMLCRHLQTLPGLANPVWEDEADLAVDTHLHQALLDPPKDLRALGRIAGDIASRPLRRDRPLWEMWLVDELEDGRVAVICKVHHAVLDGASGIGSLAPFFDLEPHGAPVVVPPRPEPQRLTTADRARESVRGSVRWARDFARSAPRVASMLVRTAQRVGDPDLALPLTAPRLSFNRALTPRRTVEFTSVELSRLKEIRRAYGATLNDLLIAVCAGALRLYLTDQDELPDRPLVAAIPVSERGLEHEVGGNRFSTMFYAIPVHIEDPAERVAATTRTAAAAKEFYEQSGHELLYSLASMLPPKTISPAMHAVSALHLADRFPPVANLMISNVRGPDFPLWIAGGRVSQMLPMGPLLEGMGLNITVVSYLDTVSFGFQVCPDLLPNVAQLAGYVDDAVAELEKAVPAS
ncbi:MAG TPA: wax ester/triacylglycerol synthase family O-acyltransferase [Acidimicrobiia bacterium]|nr:wax ester/triacylglycerol synthase family O-acyltransferase [Acidimicrobiia bacterium]